MRDPARIDKTLELIQALWKRSPDLRLGQLICNVARKEDSLSDLYNIEEEILEDRLMNLYMPGRKTTWTSGDIAKVLVTIKSISHPYPLYKGAEVILTELQRIQDGYEIWLVSLPGTVISWCAIHTSLEKI